MEAILFALVAHVGWGTSDIFGAIVSRKIGGYSLTFWSYLIRIPILGLYLPFALSVLVFQERLQRQQLWGIVSSLIGIVALSLLF